MSSLLPEQRMKTSHNAYFIRPVQNTIMMLACT